MYSSRMEFGFVEQLERVMSKEQREASAANATETETQALRKDVKDKESMLTKIISLSELRVMYG